MYNRHVRRRAITVLTLASLATAMAISALWVRGLYARDQLVFGVGGKKCIVSVFPHHVFLVVANTPPNSVATSLQTGLHRYPSRPRYWEIQYHHRPPGALRIGVPFWLPLSFAVVPPLWWLLRQMQKRFRTHAGLCRACGYDLRASKDRCPECGSPIGADDAIPHVPPSLDATERYRARTDWQISLK
jgi:hypothetical protein